MIDFSEKHLLLIPDIFGGDDKLVEDIVRDIDEDGREVAKIANLREITLEEHSGEELSEEYIIEFAANKLEWLAKHEYLLWHEDPLYLKWDEAEVRKLDEGMENIDFEDEPVDILKEEKLGETKVKKIDSLTSLRIRRSIIRAPRPYREYDKADFLVVFGKSAMLAANIKELPVIYVNPEYDAAPPWRGQYEIACKEEEKYIRDEFEAARDGKPYLMRGVENYYTYYPTLRFALYTKEIPLWKGGVFFPRYPLLTKIDRSAERLSKKIENIINHYSRGKIRNLMDIIKNRGRLDTRKRILLAGDYFLPYDEPLISRLRDRLEEMGYYTALLVNGGKLDETRRGIEHRTKKRPFDLVVSFGSGCIFTGRVRNAPRIFIDADWQPWRRMKKMLSGKKNLSFFRNDTGGPFYEMPVNLDEIWEAQKMAEKWFVLQGEYAAVGWFSPEHSDRFSVSQQLSRFEENSGSEKVMLDFNPYSDEGIEKMAKEIEKFLNFSEKVAMLDSL
ncbi:MAG: hypothetical protein K2N05_12010 [Muribaculaceae bacterium]|nr:hypothetical protein [Muribaculaceae bacterium]